MRSWRRRASSAWLRIFADEIAGAIVNARAFEEIERLRLNVFPVEVPPPTRVPEGTDAESPILTEAELRQHEQRNLLGALTKSGWKIHGQGGAAELLGIKPTTLISRIKKLGLKKPA